MSSDFCCNIEFNITATLKNINLKSKKKVWLIETGPSKANFPFIVASLKSGESH